MGENEYGKSCHLSISILLKHWMMLLKYNCSGLHFYTLSKDTDVGPCSSDFFLMETLLNNAFNLWFYNFPPTYQFMNNYYLKHSFNKVCFALKTMNIAKKMYRCFQHEQAVWTFHGWLEYQQRTFFLYHPSTSARRPLHVLPVLELYNLSSRVDTNAFVEF